MSNATFPGLGAFDHRTERRLLELESKVRVLEAAAIADEAALRVIDAASTIEIPEYGLRFLVRDKDTATQVQRALTKGARNGRLVVLVCEKATTFVDGTYLKLAGNFVGTAGDALALSYNATDSVWDEFSRSVN